MTNKNDLIEPSRFAKAFRFQGSLDYIQRLNKLTDLQIVEGAMLVEEQKLWRELGHSSFMDYLNSEDFPFGSSKYYRLLKLYKNEGSKGFDLLTGHKISPMMRLALAENKVAIELEGDEIVIAGHRAPADDKEAITELFSEINKEFVLRNEKEKDLKKANEKLQKTNEEKDRTIDNLRTNGTVDIVLENDTVIGNLIDLRATFKRLTEETQKLSPESQARWRDLIFAYIEDDCLTLSKAFNLRGDGRSLAEPRPAEDDHTASAFHYHDLAAVLPVDEAQEAENEAAKHIRLINPSEQESDVSGEADAAVPQDAPVDIETWRDNKFKTADFDPAKTSDGDGDFDSIFERFERTIADDDNDKELAAAL